jgi:peptide/nickel transport system permease protein
MMPVLLVTLWTDRLLFLLLAGVALFTWYIRRHEHLLTPWRKVARDPVGMSALVILMGFLLIGLLDSVHYRMRLDTHSADGKPQYAVEVLSVFDALAVTLRSRNEKTYSAPFATHAYAKETIEQSDGSQRRDYPRLRHGGAHLKNPDADWKADVTWKLLKYEGMAAVMWIAVSLLLGAWLAGRWDCGLPEALSDVQRGRTEVPWRSMLLTLAVVLAVVVPLAGMSSAYHVFGTDKVGQDVLYNALKSVRTGLVIGTLTTLVMLPFALLLGSMAGYFRGWVDDLIQYLYTTLNSIPGVLLIAAAVLLTQVWMDTHPDYFPTVSQRADVRLLFLCLILGITSWTGLCRLLRGEALKLRELEFVQAAQAFGVSGWRIILRHILPNVMHIVLIAMVMDFSGLVLAEAVLSYVGVGVDPSMISFGTMINNARLEMAREPMVWWSLAAAFIFMFTLVLAANLFADSVRDAFDPRIHSGWSFGGSARQKTPKEAAA